VAHKESFIAAAQVRAVAAQLSQMQLSAAACLVTVLAL
jgi:hypothetical protein